MQRLVDSNMHLLVKCHVGGYGFLNEYMGLIWKDRAELQRWNHQYMTIMMIWWWMIESAKDILVSWESQQLTVGQKREYVSLLKDGVQLFRQNRNKCCRCFVTVDWCCFTRTSRRVQTMSYQRSVNTIWMR